jgi:hypothetical protein
VTRRHLAPVTRLRLDEPRARLRRRGSERRARWDSRRRRARVLRPGYGDDVSDRASALAAWRRALTALDNALALVDNGTLASDDPVIAVLLEAESSARTQFLTPAGEQPSPARRRLVSTNLPVGSSNSLARWPQPTAWHKPAERADIADLTARVINATPKRPEDTDGLVRRTRAVVTAPTPAAGTRALSELQSFVTQVVSGVAAAEIVNLITPHLHSGR